MKKNLGSLESKLNLIAVLRELLKCSQLLHLWVFMLQYRLAKCCDQI